MASLRHKPKTKFWIGCFTDADGIRVQRSTGTTDRKLASRIVNEWEDAACRRFTEAQVRRVLSDIHERIHGARIESTTLAAYIQQWLAHKSAEAKAVTFDAYRSATEKFADFMGKKASQPIGAFRRA